MHTPIPPCCILCVFPQFSIMQISNWCADVFTSCSSVQQLNSDPREPKPSCWTTVTHSNQGHVKACCFQATSHISRHHGHTLCNLQSQESWWKWIIVWPAFFFFFNAFPFPFQPLLYARMSLWWTQEGVQQVSQVKELWIHWPPNFLRKGHQRVFLGTLHSHWAGPIQQKTDMYRKETPLLYSQLKT